MQRFFGSVALACITFNVAACSESAPVPATAETSSAAEGPSLPARDPEKVDRFNEAIGNEPKVIDFVYDPEAAVQWTIGVKDDGSPRFGYAGYLCVLMDQYGVDRTGAWIRIVDYSRYMQDGDSHASSLGSVYCQTNENRMP